jgi:hypothetical protein
MITYVLSTGLTKGPFPREELDEHVPEGHAIGVYVVGPVHPVDGDICVNYVGRFDHRHGVNQRLHDLDDDPEMTDCTHFKFDYAADARAAFEWESTIYHKFPCPLNKAHPPRPKGTNYPCPIRGMECFEEARRK